VRTIRVGQISSPVFDLQAHSTRSDGTLEPAAVVAAAARAGVELLALTDHDTVAGVEEALGAGREQGIEVLGVSPDDVASHEKFKSKYELPFTLLADTEHEVADRYGVWGEKKFMGKKYMGVNRSTFVIDEGGKVKKVFEKVTPATHADDVLAALASD